jgi:hypothetical protein
MSNRKHAVSGFRANSAWNLGIGIWSFSGVWSVVLGAFIAPVSSVRGAPAFPGALGFAANATGGRNGSVYHVTTLSDSGQGSFRDAVGTGSRIVVFDVGGYINLSSTLLVQDNITIAGQTAPGDGIGVMGREVSFNGANNVICRHFRFRQAISILTPARAESTSSTRPTSFSTTSPSSSPNLTIGDPINGGSGQRFYTLQLQ